MHSPLARLARSHRIGGDFPPATIALLFVGLVAVASIPVITHRLPPLSDYINHLARTYVINAIETDRDLARYYTIDWQFVPNLMIDLIVPILNRFMNVYVAGQVFTVLSFTAIISGTLALNRVLFGRWSALPLIAVPLLYNGVMLVGVVNYVFGIGLSLWALTAWIALRERPWPTRLAVSTLFVLALFACHLFAVGLYGLGLLAIELHRLWQRFEQPLVPRLADFVATGAPFLVVVALLVAGPTWTVEDWVPFWEFEGKIEGLRLVFNVYHSEVAVALIALIAAAGGYAWYRGWLQFHPVGWAIVLVGAAIYVAMPRAIFAAHMADQRLPIAVAFMLAACFGVQLRDRLARVGLAALLVLLVAIRVAEVQLVWNELAYRAADFLQSVRLLKQGSRVLVVRDYETETGAISDNDIVHAASLATIERSALVTTAFTVKGKHILRVRDEYRNIVETEDQLPPALPHFLKAAESVHGNPPFFWELWPRNFDYVYILFTKRGGQSPDRKHLTLVHDGTGFQLYRVLRPAGRNQRESVVR